MPKIITKANQVKYSLILSLTWRMLAPVILQLRMVLPKTRALTWLRRSNLRFPDFSQRIYNRSNKRSFLNSEISNNNSNSSSPKSKSQNFKTLPNGKMTTKKKSKKLTAPTQAKKVLHQVMIKQCPKSMHLPIWTKSSNITKVKMVLLPFRVQLKIKWSQRTSIIWSCKWTWCKSINPTAQT